METRNSNSVDDTEKQLTIVNVIKPKIAFFQVYFSKKKAQQKAMNN